MSKPYGGSWKDPQFNPCLTCDRNFNGKASSVNGLYTEAALEPKVHTHNPGIGQESSGPDGLAAMTHAAQQRSTLDDLATLTNMAKRVASMVEAYEEDAAAIEASHGWLQVQASSNDLWVAGVPEWWRQEVHVQRILREGLVDSLRDTAKRIAETYGVR